MLLIFWYLSLIITCLQLNLFMSIYRQTFRHMIIKWNELFNYSSSFMIQICFDYNSTYSYQNAVTISKLFENCGNLYMHIKV